MAGRQQASAHCDRARAGSGARSSARAGGGGACVARRSTRRRGCCASASQLWTASLHTSGCEQARLLRERFGGREVTAVTLATNAPMLSFLAGSGFERTGEFEDKSGAQVEALLIMPHGCCCYDCCSHQTASGVCRWSGGSLCAAQRRARLRGWTRVSRGTSARTSARTCCTGRAPEAAGQVGRHGSR